MKYLTVFLAIVISHSAFAHQPVMDMAPRWNDGYGIQTRVEHANSETTTWIEGVYTFNPGVRMTLKIPHANRDFGNAIFAIPLKSYTNEDGLTYNWGLTPSLRLPTANGNNYDAGLSLSYSSESPSIYQLYDLFKLGSDTGFDANYGYVFSDGDGASFFTLLDVTARDTKSGQRILSGPVLVYFKENIIVRAEYKFSVHDNDTAWDGDFFSVSVGIVY